jgi:hypothetical protein
VARDTRDRDIVSVIDVRSIRAQDLLRLPTVRTRAASLDQSPGVLGHKMIDPRSVFPFSNREHKSFVAFKDGRAVGLADLLADARNHRWVLTRVALSKSADQLSETDQSRIWEALLTHAIRAAGASRATRIHATFPECSIIVPALQDTGFTVYARETLLMARGVPLADGSETDARRQESTDAWSVHQLYHSVTPRPVQYAEALTSNFWDAGIPSPVPARGYVIEHGFEIVAYCRVVSADQRHMLQPIVETHGLDLLTTLVRDVLADISPMSDESVFVSVPDYLQEYLEPLEALGFEPAGRQLRMVKYTVVPRRMQLRALDQIAKELPERAVAGTSTFSACYDGAYSANETSAPRLYRLRDHEGLR